MNHIDSSLHRVSSPGWQILGGLELTVDPDIDHTISKWLGMILSPLNLRADFLNNVLKSAQEAAARAMQNEMKFEHIHLLVFAPSDRATTGQTWGFFRIEKVGATAENGNPLDHSIEFYLYMEGR